MFLDREAFEDFKLSKEERELQKELKDLGKKDTASTDKKDSKKGKKDKKDEEKKDTKPFTPDFTDREDRVLRLTSASGSVSDALINTTVPSSTTSCAMVRVQTSGSWTLSPRPLRSFPQDRLPESYA